jgi:hypothetical protein
MRYVVFFLRISQESIEFERNEVYLYMLLQLLTFICILCWQMVRLDLESKSYALDAI